MTTRQEHVAKDDDDDVILWGARAISVEADRTPRQTFYLLEKGLLPGWKIGSIWVSTKGKIRRRVRGEDL